MAFVRFIIAPSWEPTVAAVSHPCFALACCSLEHLNGRLCVEQVTSERFKGRVKTILPVCVFDRDPPATNCTSKLLKIIFGRSVQYMSHSSVTSFCRLCLVLTKHFCSNEGGNTFSRRRRKGSKLQTYILPLLRHSSYGISLKTCPT